MPKEYLKYSSLFSRELEIELLEHLHSNYEIKL